MPTDFPFLDKQEGPEIREKLNAMWATWLEALETAVGKDGWSPLLRTVADGQRQVIELYDWFGGATAKPATGFMGAAGLVATAAEAVDFRGSKGDKGDEGDAGPANQLSTGTITTGAPGSSVEASITGEYPDQVLNLTIPRGDPGDPGATPTVSVGTVTTGAPGTSAEVVPSGTPTNLILNFTIPRGDPGTGGGGSGDVVGPAGVDDLQLAQFDGPTGKAIRALDLTGILAVDEGRPYVAGAGTDYATPAQVAEKQDTLVSGTNIKTVNGVDLPGSGDALVQWKAVAIPSAADLDTYQSEGVFAALTSIIAASLLNSPTAVSFSLRVWKTAGVVQEVTEFQANSTRKTYQRAFALGVWSAWARVYTTIDVPTKTAIGLGSVDNTSDADKPVSSAQQTALNLKQDKETGKGLSTNDYTTTDKDKLGALSPTGLISQNSQSAAYTLVLEDMGKHIFHPAADTTARIFTIPANIAVAFPIGAAVTFVNQNGTGGVITIAITTDTMRLAGAGTTGSRTLARNGIATALKITATEWIISGSGLT